MNWLEKYRKKIEDMKMPEKIVTVSMRETQILKSIFRGNKDVNEIRLPQTACAGDNHILFEVHRLEKSEKLWKYFEGDFEHYNGWTVVLPEAYHYITEYVSISEEWASCDSY